MDTKLIQNIYVVLSLTSVWITKNRLTIILIKNDFLFEQKIRRFFT